jgi:hypothetical protein
MCSAPLLLSFDWHVLLRAGSDMSQVRKIASHQGSVGRPVDGRRSLTQQALQDHINTRFEHSVQYCTCTGTDNYNLKDGRQRHSYIYDTVRGRTDLIQRG